MSKKKSKFADRADERRVARKTQHAEQVEAATTFNDERCAQIKEQFEKAFADELEDLATENISYDAVLQNQNNPASTVVIEFSHLHDHGGENETILKSRMDWTEQTDKGIPGWRYPGHSNVFTQYPADDFALFIQDTIITQIERLNEQASE